MTATVERRKEVLALAKEHNFLILEGTSHSVSTKTPHHLITTTILIQTTPISISTTVLLLVPPRTLHLKPRNLRLDGFFDLTVFLRFFHPASELVSPVDQLLCSPRWIPTYELFPLYFFGMLLIPLPSLPQTATANLQVSSLTQIITVTLLNSWG